MINSNRLFGGGNDIMIGGSGANYFDCGPNDSDEDDDKV
jgi:Ca2+-binding RTX toxin-like protein